MALLAARLAEDYQRVQLSMEALHQEHGTMYLPTSMEVLTRGVMGSTELFQPPMQSVRLGLAAVAMQLGLVALAAMARREQAVRAAELQLAESAVPVAQEVMA
jgi:hypothetical protein